MGFIHALADIAAVILTFELLVLLVVPAFLLAFFGRKGMAWLIGPAGKFTWAIGMLHTGLTAAAKIVRRAEDVAVAPIITVASLWAGTRGTLRSLRRRADQPLSRLRRSA